MIKTERGRLAIEGIVIAFGQVLGAVGALVGMRLLTEFVPPALFGELAVVMATLALCQGILYFPLGQAALRYFPDVAASRQEAHLRQIIVREYISRFNLLGLVCLGAAAVGALIWQHFSWSAFFLAITLLALDGWKTLEIVLSNGARKQVSYSFLVAADGSARPIFAAISAWLWQPSLQTVLLGQCCAALITLVVFRCMTMNSNTKGVPIAETTTPSLAKKLNAYAKPLAWAPIIGWVAGVADRYIIGGLLGFAAAGIYAAAYGLASRPFILLGTVSEATFRQPYYAAVSAGQSAKSSRLFKTWLGLNVMTGIAGVAVIWLWRGQLTALLLAPAYQAAADLLPWIALGYTVLAISQAYERMGYAYGDTSRITAIQLIGAILAVGFGFAGTYLVGILGAAIAVPAYFSAQLILTRQMAKHSAANGLAKLHGK